MEYPFFGALHGRARTVRLGSASDVHGRAAKPGVGQTVASDKPGRSGTKQNQSVHANISDGSCGLDINERIARRVIQLREERSLTIDELANRSGVSRAMISRIERVESSPTAAVLNKLATGLGVLLPSLFGASDYREPRLLLRNPVASRRSQAETLDPSSGYRRRTLTPSAAKQPMQLGEVLFPAGASVTFDGVAGGGTSQQLWLLRGQLEIRVDEEMTILNAGDCIAMTVSRSFTIHNAGSKDARYVVATFRSG